MPQHWGNVIPAFPEDASTAPRRRPPTCAPRNISRLGAYGATLKNYCITLATAICGLAFTANRPVGGLLALLPIIVCALLDAQYLRTERRFRDLFHVVRQQDWGTQPTFDIHPTWRPS